RQLFVEYPGGLRLWLNDHASENWVVTGNTRRTAAGEGARAPMITLPPAGWAVFTDDDKLFSFSALQGTNRVDYLRSPAYTYLDGRGSKCEVPEAVCDGALVIRGLAKQQLKVTHASGNNEFVIRRPYGVHGKCVGCEVTDVEGKALGKPVWQDSGSE